ncbi:Na+/H+ antiporter subunit E [Paenalcaligenes faecalis]|uniref:Na+/H+ antiporter subunit E n=1 Tax=Paenalcaligenes faecalis TaxID=2980099 RepID=UPI0022B9A76D|nr:Na+/H+ antiporter subunit E [Paenalcaligenes faecalis]
MIKKHLRFIFLPLLLAFLWILLNGFSKGQIVLAIFLAVLLSIAAIPFRPVRASMQHPFTVIKLWWRVVIDIVKSNYEVAYIVLFTKSAQPTPGFLDIPLTLRDPHGLAALACIITYTPGTVWSGFNEKTNILTLHILDLTDEQFWLDTIQQRYQAPLIEIFE